MKVLLVDDDPMIRHAYGRLLENAGFTVITGSSGREGLEQLKLDTTIGVVITDLRMPEADGLDFLRDVRSRSPDLCFLLMTGTPDVTSAIAAIEAGVFRYLVKPVQPQQLITAVNAAGRVHRLAQLKRQVVEIAHLQADLGDGTTLNQRFNQALAALRLAFQPIMDTVTGKTAGYEALVRSGEPTMSTPDKLFDAAEQLGRVHDLGREIRRRAAVQAAAGREHLDYFVNLHSADLNDADLYDERSPLSLVARRVVLEITERRSLEQVADVGDRMRMLRELGFRIAVDDLGAGYAGLASFGALEPEVVKLDMSLVRDIDHAEKKRALVGAMIDVCRKELKIKVVCEGVETAAEHEVLKALGADLLQGYLFGRPTFPETPGGALPIVE